MVLRLSSVSLLLPSQDKIERPSMDIWQSGGPIISLILKLITEERTPR